MRLLSAPSSRAVRHQENVPGAIVSVGVDGAVSTFSPELLGIPTLHGRCTFGNVLEMWDLGAMFLRPSFLRLRFEIQKGVNACRKGCAYYRFCGGGSPSNKIGEHGSFDVTETRFCQLAVKTTVDAVLERAAGKRVSVM
jgi:uncharacterized protein